MEEFGNRITIHYKLKKGRWEGGEWQGWERWRRRGEEREVKEGRGRRWAGGESENRERKRM